MIKKNTVVFLLLIVMATTAYAAPDRVGKVDVGFNVSGAIPRDGDVDSAAYVGGSLAYGVQEWLALGVEAGWAGFGESDAGISVDENAFPVLGDIIFRIPMQSDIKPYAIVGLGAIFWSVDTNLSNISADIDTAFAAKFGGGVDWFVNDNWAVNFEVSYVLSSTDATVKNNTTGASITASGDTDYWMVGGGIKYLFS